MKNKISTFCILTIGFLLNCGAQVPNSDRVLDEIVDGQRDPAPYRDLIVSNTSKLEFWLKNHWPVDPKITLNYYLASLNFEWGNYQEAMFFSKQEAYQPKASISILRLFCSVMYSDGNRGVMDDLKLNDDNKDRLKPYVEFESFAASQASSSEKRKLLRHLSLVAGNTVYNFLNALISYPNYKPSADELNDVLGKEISFIFDFQSDLKIADLDAGVINPPVTPGKRVFESRGRYFYLSLISLDMAAQYKRLGLDAETKIWESRSEKSLRAADSVKDLKKSWKNRYKLTAEKLGMDALAKMVSENKSIAQP